MVTFLPMNPPSTRPHLFGLLAGLFLATGISFASIVMARAWTRIHESQLIDVTGSARKNVRADLVIWHASFSVEAPTLLAAQQQLTADRVRIDAWLAAHRLNEVSALPVQIRDLTVQRLEQTKTQQTTRETRVGYKLTQALVVRSPEVERLPRLAGGASELIEQGVSLASDGFEFIYTPVAGAKIEMMAEATKDARQRAEQIAQQGGRKLNQLQTARMGVVQINPLYSSATSWEGNNDTTSLEKTIIATVNATFSLH
jgi:hypothetical protein